MKSLNRRFEKISQLNPKWSSHNCFAEAVKKQNFSRKIILYWFNKLVEKNDYGAGDKRAVVEYLVELSIKPKKKPEAGIK